MVPKFAFSEPGSQPQSGLGISAFSKLSADRCADPTAFLFLLSHKSFVKIAVSVDEDELCGGAVYCLINYS